MTDSRFGELETHKRNQRDIEFLAADRAGYSARELAVLFNITTRTVQRWRHRLGVSREQFIIQKHPESDRRRVEALLDEGCSFTEAARTVGVSERTIYRWFPDRTPWSKQEVVEYAVLVRTLGKVAA